jgi:two-component system response regulator ResD
MGPVEPRLNSAFSNRTRGESRVKRLEVVGPVKETETKRLVLVVDDDAGIRQLVALHLQRLGCDVLEAPDGKEAVRLAVEHQPDLLVVDVRMPGISGYDVTREVRRLLPGRVPVLLMSGSILSADMSQGFEAGADAYLKKPFKSEDLLHTVKALLAPATTRSRWARRA